MFPQSNNLSSVVLDPIGEQTVANMGRSSIFAQWKVISIGTGRQIRMATDHSVAMFFQRS